MTARPPLRVPEGKMETIRHFMNEICTLLDLGPEYRIQITGSQYERFELTIYEDIS